MYGFFVGISLEFRIKRLLTKAVCRKMKLRNEVKFQSEMRDATKRHQFILAKLQSEHQVSVDSLAQAMRTSEVTVRKDLNVLEKQGLLVRRYGGAQLVEGSNIAPVDVADHEVSNRKNEIALCALELIPDGARIVLDGGSTVGALIPLLAKRRGLVIMTNSPQAASKLVELESEPTVLMTGGTWDATSRSLQGKMAERVLREYDFDLAFVGASGIDTERGTTTYNELFGLTRVMADVASKVVVMAGSDKLDKKMPNLELGWNHIDVLVTDSQLSPVAKQSIESKRVTVLCANHSGKETE